MDGSLQRQMVLMKLSHEMDNRPDFGNSYDNDPDGAVQQWLARVGALMDRVSISRSVAFNASLQTAAQYWVHAIRSVQTEVYKAIEDLRLELELTGNSQVGSVYDSEKKYEFFQDIAEVIGAANHEVFVVDPYFDALTFSKLFSSNFKVDVRILCGKEALAVAAIAKEFSEESGAKAIVRKTRDSHDRLLLIDKAECWVIGSSIKDAGRKPTYLLPLIPDLAEQKMQIYETIWARAVEPSK